MSWQDDYKTDLTLNYQTPPLLLVKGKASEVWDNTGRRFLDFLGGIAVNSLGHAHPALTAAIAKQADTLTHVSNLMANDQALQLARTLKRLAGTADSGRVFFCNSGAEANEAAFKLALIHKPGGKVIALNHSFHGRTMGALALTGKPSIKTKFLPMLPQVVHIDATIAAIEQAITDDTAAVILETIQGEAGVLPLSAEFVQKARELTSAHGALLIIDEVQTGIARTGNWFSFQSLGVTPDVITLAKGIAGGFPMGATIAYGAASELFQPGDHGTTFGGTALGASVANAVISVIESEDLLSNVKARSQQLIAGIYQLNSKLIDRVQGVGLMLGVVLTKPLAKQIYQAALDLGLIINAPTPDTIRLLPALNVSAGEVSEFITLFAAAIESVANQTAAEEN